MLNYAEDPFGCECDGEQISRSTTTQLIDRLVALREELRLIEEELGRRAERGLEEVE